MIPVKHKIKISCHPCIKSRLRSQEFKVAWNSLASLHSVTRFLLLQIQRMNNLESKFMIVTQTILKRSIGSKQIILTRSRQSTKGLGEAIKPLRRKFSRSLTLSQSGSNSPKAKFVYVKLQNCLRVDQENQKIWTKKQHHKFLTLQGRLSMTTFSTSGTEDSTDSTSVDILLTEWVSSELLQLIRRMSS